LSIALACAVLHAQVSVSGRVVDETGAPVPGARVELSLPGAPAIATSSDAAGNFTLSLAAGDYDIRVERLGFFLYQGKGQHLEEGDSRLAVTLNHTQEFSERVDVTASPPAIDPQQASAHKELDNAEIMAVPYPAPQDYRNALFLMNGVIQDSNGAIHVNGGGSNQTSYTLDGFNISNPVTGSLDARVNIETIQSVNLETSRFSADTGRGSAGALDLQTKMGDDYWRFMGTNFIPGVSTADGLHIDKWTPRLEVSGPIVKGRAWFHNGLDAFYSNDIVHGLPTGQNRTSGITASDLARIQVNPTSSNIVTASFLANVAETSHDGLTILNPVETTSTQRQLLFVSSVRDQQYIGGGALLEAGFSDTRTLLRDIPQGDEVYQITPSGNRGNYFVDENQHGYRQQWIANLFLPTKHLWGSHQFKFGADIERESFHQKRLLSDYEVLNADDSVARYVSFQGSPFQGRKNFEEAQYVQDHWTPVKGLAFEAGLRAEWNEIVRDVLLAPRLAIVWAPSRLPDTKFSAGWGVYYDAISLALVSHQQQQSLATFYGPDGTPQTPVLSSFQVDDQALQAPRYRTAAFGVERKLPFAFYLKAEYTHRDGDHGFVFMPPDGGVPVPQPEDATGSLPPSAAVYTLANTRRDRYDALDLGVRRTFKGQFEWFAGYTRSASRTNEAMNYSLENPIFGPQLPGPFPWDAPNRFHMWGWVPVPSRRFPGFLRFVTKNTTAAYLVEYRTGFPYSVVDQDGFQVGPPGSVRYPDYFNVNLHFERKFMAFHYLWAWRFGFNNLTNNGNYITVNNVIGTPAFQTYGRGQVRAFSVRLRMLGRK
jgi:hypothetical protein